MLPDDVPSADRPAEQPAQPEAAPSAAPGGSLEAPAPSAPDGGQDFLLDLSLVPQWAREPSRGGNPYSDYAGEGAGRDDGRGRRDARPGGPGRGGPGRGGPGRGPRDGQRRGAPGGGMGGGMGGARGGERQDRRGPGRRGPPRRDREERPVRLPIDVSFIPERNHLGAVVRQIHASQKAYPLFQLATLFLSKPEYYQVKLESRHPEFRLCQCSLDKAVFLGAEALKTHAVSRLLETEYEAVDIPMEAPTGNFVCVGRCRLSGELLGPPNYHGFNERLQELHRTRFSHLSIDAYRAQIEMVRDPAVVEQWKESCKSRRVYRPRDAGENAPQLRRAEAEARFLARHGAKLMEWTGRAILPATVAQAMEEPILRRTIGEAWQREHRHPLRMAMALRPAFKRMRLFLFKGARGEIYVTGVEPCAIDPAHTVDPLRSILGMLVASTDANRQKLLDALKPGTTPEAPEAAELMTALRWLIEKGHVIEFFNGTLIVPTVAHAQTVERPAGDTKGGTEPAADSAATAPAGEPMAEAAESPAEDVSAPAADEATPPPPAAPASPA